MMRTFRKNVGILGLGIIGRRIADHLRHQGLAVFVWNRTPRPVPNFVGSPAELAEICNYLQLFVSNDEALMRVIQELTPSLTQRHIVIAHATVSPETMREAAALVQRKGARLVEAPFTGSKLAAEKGELVYYVGGDETALAEVRPLLEASSKSILLIGDVGHASIVKIATNLVTAASVQAAAEALALVHYSGIPLEKFAEAMKHNGSNSGTLDMKLPGMMTANFEPHFSVKHMLKDIQIANHLGRDFDLDLGVAHATRDRLLEEARQGRGDQDYSSVARKFLPFMQEEPTEPEQPDLFSQTPEPLENEEPDFLEQQRAKLEAAGLVAHPHSNAALDLPPEPEPLLTLPNRTPEPAAFLAEPAELEPQIAALEPEIELESETAALEPETELEPETAVLSPEPEITLPPPPEPPRPQPEPEKPREGVKNGAEEEVKRGGFLSRILGRTADY
jgi:3-hydroxyisobutyrate dehydrogenase-like beta-hydroxyacid dehydrogenase